MACSSDYLAPDARERELQRAAKLLVYLRKQTGREPEAWVKKEAKNIYAKDERLVTELCSALESMDPQERDTIIYNARDKNARDLADWWEEYQTADAERKKQEAASNNREKTKKQALAKLSKKE